MKKTFLFALLLMVCSLHAFAWKYKVQQCEIESVTNNCCFKLWISIDKVDDNGQFMQHICAGYVYTGCCTALPAHDRDKENTSCADQYNGEYFYTDKSSVTCMVPAISDAGCYALYTKARDEKINMYKASH